MATPNRFDSTNPFAPTSNTMQRQRRGSTINAAPKPPKPPSPPPSLPPNTRNGGNYSEQQMRQQLFRYENMYKQTKNQLEVLKAQFRGTEKELSQLKSQKHLIETNHSNIVSWQRKISELEMEKQTLIDKNGLFLQQKNTYLLQLADQQQMCDELKVEIDSKNAENEKLETEMTNSSQNYLQQLSKKDNKYKSLKQEYHSLNKEFLEKKNKNKLMTEQLDAMAIQVKDLKQENILFKDKYEKLSNEHDILKTDHEQIQTQISQVNEDSTIAVQLASKKDKNIIKDLRQTLKTETIKLQQLKAENLQLKDELNDLRDWRENYLRQQKLQQIQSQPGHGSRESSQENRTTPEDVADNISVTSSTASNQTASSKSSNRNHITYKEKIKIMRKKSVTAINNARSTITVPSLQNLLSSEFGAIDDEKTQPMPVITDDSTTDENKDTLSSNTKEHDEFIEALSDRLAIVKENYINLKQVVTNKDTQIEKLKSELEKKKEWITDLIEKLNDKPLPPTPAQLDQLEQAEYEQKDAQIHNEENKVLMNLEQQGLSPMLNRRQGRTHNGNSQQLLKQQPPQKQRVHRPPIPSVAPPPPNKPAPKVVVSPSYNKTIGQNSHYSYPQPMSESHHHYNNNGHNINYLMQDQSDEDPPELNYMQNEGHVMNGDGI